MKILKMAPLFLVFAIIFVLQWATTSSASEDEVGIIVHTSKPYDSVISAIEGLGGNVTYQYENVDGIAVSIREDQIAILQALDGVDTVEKDRVIVLTDPSDDLYKNLSLNMQERELLGMADLAELGFEPASYSSYLSSVTGAQDTWAATNFGEGAIVAVIDTGSQASHGCLSGRVLEGPDFSTDSGGPFEGSVASTNHIHGTAVAGQIASLCAILVPPGHPFDTHLPTEAKIPIPGGFLVPIFGIAPFSEIYAVKVFPHTGAGASSSRISAAIDHVITQKKTGAIDIDVLNMSLGGASLHDGRTFQEMLVDEASKADITVVVSAGNEGPSPNTVARPGTAYSALTVAAAVDQIHARIILDVLFGPGAGVTLYPTDELRIAEFSSQGPYADGRVGPDITAIGVANFGPFTSSGGTALGWASGTSFSAPQVSGAAALLTSWAENNAPRTTSSQIRNALIDGAADMGEEWGTHSQGQGFLNVVNSLNILKKSGMANRGLRRASIGGRLSPNVKFDTQGEYRASVTLERGRWSDWVFMVDENTVKVVIEINPVGGPIPPGPSGGFGLPESFKLFVKSAKRGGVAPDFVDGANIIDSGTVEISAGEVVASGGIVVNPLTSPPSVLEPGLMKVTLQSARTNNTQFLSADVTISIEKSASGPTKDHPIRMTIQQSEFQPIPVEIPVGTNRATFDLSWTHDWSKFPTNDLDMLFVSPSSFPSLEPLFAGATFNSPEQQVIVNPEAGTWLVVVNGFTVQRGRDPYVLEITLEE